MVNPPEQSWSENHTEGVEGSAKNGVKIIKKGKKPQKVSGDRGTEDKNWREKPPQKKRLKGRNCSDRKKVWEKPM